MSDILLQIPVNTKKFKNGTKTKSITKIVTVPIEVDYENKMRLI